MMPSRRRQMLVSGRAAAVHWEVPQKWFVSYSHMSRRKCQLEKPVSFIVRPKNLRKTEAPTHPQAK